MNNIRKIIIAKWKLVLEILIVLFIIFNSLAIIYYRHLNRQNFTTLQKLHQQHNALYIEWTKLILENSTLYNYSWIDEIARHKIHMHSPQKKDIVYLTKNIISK